MRAPLFFTEISTFYVSSYNKGRHFRLSSKPLDQSIYSKEFQFSLEHPQGNPKEKPYFIYTGVYDTPSILSSVLDVSNHFNFPLDVVVLSRTGNSSRRINLVDRSPYSHMFTVGDHSNDDYCCARKIVFSFYAVNVTQPGKKITTIKVC